MDIAVIGLLAFLLGGEAPEQKGPGEIICWAESTQRVSSFLSELRENCKKRQENVFLDEAQSAVCRVKGPITALMYAQGVEWSRHEVATELFFSVRYYWPEGDVVLVVGGNKHAETCKIIEVKARSGPRFDAAYPKLPGSSQYYSGLGREKQRVEIVERAPADRGKASQPLRDGDGQGNAGPSKGAGIGRDAGGR